MSRRYTSDEKAVVLSLLQSSGYNIVVTSLQTGIPERTLRYWRRQQNLAKVLPLPPHTPSAAAAAISEDFPDAERFKLLRRQILDHISTLTASLTNGLDTASPFHRVLALSQLFEHLKRLEVYMPRDERKNKIVIEFMDEHGNVYSELPPSDDDDEEGEYPDDQTDSTFVTGDEYMP